MAIRKMKVLTRAVDATRAERPEILRGIRDTVAAGRLNIEKGRRRQQGALMEWMKEDVQSVLEEDYDIIRTDERIRHNLSMLMIYELGTRELADRLAIELEAIRREKVEEQLQKIGDDARSAEDIASTRGGTSTR